MIDLGFDTVPLVVEVEDPLRDSDKVSAGMFGPDSLFKVPQFGMDSLESHDCITLRFQNCSRTAIRRAVNYPRVIHGGSELRGANARDDPAIDELAHCDLDSNTLPIATSHFKPAMPGLAFAELYTCGRGLVGGTSPTAGWPRYRNDEVEVLNQIRHRGIMLAV
jgi:hypothetical protein